MKGCNIVTGSTTLTVGLVYRSPNISVDENQKVQNAIKEVSKLDCIIIGDFKATWSVRGFFCIAKSCYAV